MASNFSSCLKPSAVQSFLGVSIFYLAPFFFFFFVGSESLGTYCIQPSSTLALLASILQQIPMEYFCSSIVLWSSFNILYYVPHSLPQLCFCQVQLANTLLQYSVIDCKPDTFQYRKGLFPYIFERFFPVSCTQIAIVPSENS